MYCMAAESAALADTTTVLDSAPACSSVCTTPATLEAFCPTAQ